MEKIRLGVLIGSGSRLPATWEYIQKHKETLELSVVVSYKKESPKVLWAKERGIPAYYHRWISYKQEGKTREEFNQDLAILLKKYNVNLVFGLGWDIIWTPNFFNAFPDRVINAHPFPLPDEAIETITYKDSVVPVLRGMNTLYKAWEMELPITGACVHFASETIDMGPVIVREVLEINPHESFEELERRHIPFEGIVLTKALDLFIQNDVTVENNRVVIRPKKKEVTTNNKKKKTVLVIGGGGREHAIIWKLSQSPSVEKIYCAPGNAGTAQFAENVVIQAYDIKALGDFALEKDIDLTFVGPEDPLAAGIVDTFQKKGLRIFGPSQKAAQIEASKAWAVEFMARHNIPHPHSKIFTSVDEVTAYVEKLNGNCVLKCDGLTLGKGVIVCQNLEETKKGIERIMISKEFGKAGETVIVQERIVGQEVSVMAFCDGKVAIPIIPAQDHKRVFDNDRGPNTGGIGAYAPAPFVTPTLSKKIHRILTLTVESMKEEEIPYVGILYGGFMVVSGDPYVLEFNCRFGDPETQVQLPLLESDLMEIFEACIDSRLTPDLVRFSNKSSVCVVLTSGGYPGKYETGIPIRGLDNLKDTREIQIFHAGTQQKNGIVKTNGGRVLGVTAVADTLKDAIDKAYSVIEKPIFFEQMHYRHDIGAKALRAKQGSSLT